MAKKKRRKGFTLIELLAVIMLIALVGLIVIPIITRNYNAARRKVFETKLYALADAAETYYNDEYLDSNIVFEEGLDGVNTFTINLSDPVQASVLNMKGKTFDKGIVTITEDGRISVIAKDNSFCGQKLAANELVEILDIDSNVSCGLLDSIAGGSGMNAAKLIAAIQNLSDSHASLTNQINTLNGELDDLETYKLGTTEALDKLYPVGSIYMSTNLDTAAKVKIAFGNVGTWEAYGTDRVLRGTTGTAGQTGGSSTVSLTTDNLPSHTHTLNSHTHSVSGTTAANNQGHTHTYSGTTAANNRGHTHSISFTTGNNKTNHTHTVTTNATTARLRINNAYMQWLDSVVQAGGNQPAIGGGTNRPLYINLPNISGSTGGNQQNHNHTFSVTSAGENQNHTHTFSGTTAGESQNHTHAISVTTGASSAANTGSAGSGTAFSVLDSYITVYMYRRTA